MTTEEQDAKAARDLADTQRVILRSTRILKRIEDASEWWLKEGKGNGDRPQTA